MLGAWAAAGAPAGEESAEAHVPPSAEGGIGVVDLELSPATGYVTSGDFDELRCFVLDPGLTDEVYLAAQEIVPGNPAVVHHVTVFVDPARESASQAGPDGSYDCFGGPNLSSADLVGAWVPGMPGLELPADVGIRVPAGSLFVMQVHYHPRGPEAAPDATTVRLRLADGKPQYRAQALSVGNFPAPFGEHDGLLPGPDDDGAPIFRIRAGASGHVESMRLTLSAPTPMRVLAVGNHMHYLGTDMRTTVVHAAPEPGQPAEECLLQTPRWDFSWQRGYLFDAPVEALPELRPGDQIELRCTYDNSLANPQVVAVLNEHGLPQPVDVFLGEQSLDEMCNIGLVVIVPNL